ncbi:MAG TPA: sugar phosphate isomerase/epimerase [Ruminiclostridium sp.]|nr:sugar phosphate isomerase/epimerase [Ruminiclostridium sp.]
MNRISQTVPYQYDTTFSPFKTSEFEVAIEFLAEKGFTGVELAVAYPGQVDDSKLLKQLAPYRLAVTSLSTGQIYGLEGLFLSSSDKEVSNRAIQIVKGHIDLSTVLGNPPVTIGLIRGKLEKDGKSILLGNLKSALLKCVEYAYKRNVVLQLEPICKAETSIINSTYDGLDFLKEMGDPENVGLLYDTYHSNLEDGRMIEAIQAAAGRITNVHFADSTRGLPGSGTINFSSIYEAIQKTGYQGAYALETLSIPSVDYVKENFAASMMNIVKS